MSQGWRAFLAAICALLVLLPAGIPGRADSVRLHKNILVFVPAYEGSMLYDATLNSENKPVCVWGDIDAITSSDLYFSLRVPNPLTAKEMLTAGPIDVYGKFVSALTGETDDKPAFRPYTEGSDFFVYAYDWRQEIATVTAPDFAEQLKKYAEIHETKTGVPAAETKFVIVTHSMGGLVARTFLSERPDWAERIAGLYLVGSPNLGSVKAVKTVVTGPGGLKENALNFPASLLNLLPNNVDADVTKLTAIARPSLYELLPFDDPRWECVDADGHRSRVAAQDLLTVGPWQRYWPSAELEKKLFIDGWLTKRQTEGRKKIEPNDWVYCQDSDLRLLQKMLAQTREWRLKLGSLSYTNTLLTKPGEPSRLRVILGTGLKTPTGVITEGAHDFCTARYTYAPDNDGDETVTGASVLDDLHATSSNVKLLDRVSHGHLMSDRQFLTYFWNELADEPLVAVPTTVARAAPSPGAATFAPMHLAPGSTVP